MVTGWFGTEVGSEDRHQVGERGGSFSSDRVGVWFRQRIVTRSSETGRISELAATVELAAAFAVD